MDKRRLQFDFCIEKFKVLIELDGNHHFMQVAKWTDPHVTQKRDIFKMVCAKNNRYSVIRIYQPDVWKDKNNWKKNLRESIRFHLFPHMTYLGELYKDHHEKLMKQLIVHSDSQENYQTILEEAIETLIKNIPMNNILK